MGKEKRFIYSEVNSISGGKIDATGSSECLEFTSARVKNIIVWHSFNNLKESG